LNSWNLTTENLSVRYCRIQITPHVEKKGLLEPDHRAITPFRVQSEGAWLKMGSGLYRRGQPMGKGESLWSLIICDHQMEQVNMPGWLSNWKFLSCFASQETIRQGETSGHKSGGLVSVLAFRPPQECHLTLSLSISHESIYEISVLIITSEVIG
jgi:hypothetical protein